MFAILDEGWQPRIWQPAGPDWTAVTRALLAQGSRWLALVQLRSGMASPVPMPGDVALTRALFRHLRLLDMHLVDHLIVQGDTHFSFRARGLL
ncbi:hypothetical protein J3E64_002739 [Sphingobium sp. OAS761]|uniref:JAB domain-containing protein n=1 Tax=Sphingobium sp. OAS761 TaxID=2817901 RepID=UPI00209C7BAF|nr:JAB domain-containing protein [Sphingobium sp. OAS761]MCP1471042.1 hypothetical protein [Sphingobium sp. OAS761]